MGYWVLEAVYADIRGAVYPDSEVGMGVLSGILAGLLAAYLYDRFHTIKLPEWLAFFGCNHLN